MGRVTDDGGTTAFTALGLLLPWRTGSDLRTIAGRFSMYVSSYPTAASPVATAWPGSCLEPSATCSQSAFTAQSGEFTVGELLDATYTDGLLVIHRGAIVTEQYFNGLRPSTPHLLMSVSKSITGLVAGPGRQRCARRLRDRREHRARAEATPPSRRAVQHLLDMRAGTRFTEDYDDPDAEITVSDRVYRWSPGRRAAAPGRRASSTSPPSATTGRTAAPSATGRSLSTCWPGFWSGRPIALPRPGRRASCGSRWAPSTTPRSPSTPRGNALADGGSAPPCATRAGSASSPCNAEQPRRGVRWCPPPGSTTPSRAPRRPGRVRPRRRRGRLPARRPLPQLLVGHPPRAPAVQRGRHSRPAHRRRTSPARPWW